MFSEAVLKHFFSPRNVGLFDTNDERVTTAVVNTSSGSDVIQLQILTEQDAIMDARFKCFGGVATIATCSLVTEWLKNKTLDAALEIISTDIASELSLSSVKLYAALLGEEAIKEVVRVCKLK